MRRLLVAHGEVVKPEGARSEIDDAKAAIRVATLISVLHDEAAIERAATVAGLPSATVEKVVRALAQST